MLLYLRERDFPWDHSTCTAVIARNESLQKLPSLLDQDYPLNEGTCKAVTGTKIYRSCIMSVKKFSPVTKSHSHSRLELIMIICKCESVYVKKAVLGLKEHVRLQLLIITHKCSSSYENNAVPPWDKRACEAAAETGNLEILECFRDFGINT
jgi:hypothetical protein